MNIVKISDSLWRINNKDVWLRHGLIVPPYTPSSQLTDEEKSFVETELKKTK